MSTEAGFLADICDRPGDDIPRLVFADWLEDNGDPDRAEFIRAQIRLEGMPEYDPERFELEERSQDLLAEHRERWLAGLPAWARAEPLTFRRGLVSEARLSPGRFLSRGDKFVKLVPLTRLTLDGLKDRAGELAGLAATRGLAELELAGVRANAPRLGEFLAGFESEQLRQLIVTGNSMGQVAGEALSGWAGLKGLTGLGVRRNNIGDDRVAAILDSPHLGALEWLDLNGSSAGPQAAARLAYYEHLSGLRHLDLSGDAIGDAGTRALASAPWHRLESLLLPGYFNTPAELKAVLDAKWFGGLRSLRLNNWFLGLQLGPLLATAPAGLRHLELDTCQMDSAGVRAVVNADLAEWLRSLVLRLSPLPGVARLGESSRLGNLARLSVAATNQTVGAAEARVLVESAQLPALHHLELLGFSLDAEGAALLAGLPGLGRLRSLTLRPFAPGLEGVGALARSPHLGGLARLDLAGTDLRGRGLQALLQAPWLASLRELNLSCPGLDDGDMADLAKCPALSRLRVLDLGMQRITSAGAAALADSPHLGRLLRLRLDAFGPDARAARDRLRERFGGVLVLS